MLKISLRQTHLSHVFWPHCQRRANDVITSICLVTGLLLFIAQGAAACAFNTNPAFIDGIWQDKFISQYAASPRAADVWPRVDFTWDLPDGLLPQEVIEQHSKPDLLLNWDDETPLQVVFHRGLYDQGAEVQEDSLSSLRIALQTGNLVEIDIAITRDGHPIIAHELNTYRVTQLEDKLWSELYLHEIEDTPLIIRGYQGEDFTSTYRVTNDTVVTLATYLEVAFEVNPHATVLLDAREYHGHIIVDWLTHRPQYRDRVAVLFYSFKYRSGHAFAQAVDTSGATRNWRSTVALIPALFPETLPGLALENGAVDLNEDALFAAGRKWIDSMLSQQMRVVSFIMMMARVPPYEHSDAQNDDPVALAFAAEQAIVRIAGYIKSTYPSIKLSTGTRSYVYSSDIGGEKGFFGIDLFTGRPRQWPVDARKRIHQGYAIPGNAAALADLVISDRPYDDMAIQQWRRRGINRKADFDFPPFNVGVCCA